MGEPEAPDIETREHLLGVLADFIARTGAKSFLFEPVAPGEQNFPEPWANTRAGVQLLLRRLAWHASAVPGVGVDRVAGVGAPSAGSAGIGVAGDGVGVAGDGVGVAGDAWKKRAIEVDDQTIGAPPTERKPATRCELLEVHRDRAVFELGFVGDDDVVGTLAHEIGLLYAVTHRPDEPDPYRTAEPPVIIVEHDRDPERGSIATVYLGLGVLAANAAYQQYSRAGRFNGAYEPLEYDVLNAGALPMSSLAFLLAVQAVVRGTDKVPAGLSPPQRDEVSQWIDTIAVEREKLRTWLGISSAELQASGLPQRPRVERFADSSLDAREARSAKNAFRWHTHRGGMGLLLGLGTGFGAAVVMHTPQAFGLMLLGGGIGTAIGRFMNVPRCSACATTVRADSTHCRKCGARFRGDIQSLNQRLEEEERLEALQRHASGDQGDEADA
jgi:hypothetical protein